ncbi:MAG: hypothetical protein ACRCYQ_13600 [Nocardioides sp.]
MIGAHLIRHPIISVIAAAVLAMPVAASAASLTDTTPTSAVTATAPSPRAATASEDPNRLRYERLCARVPLLETRRENLVAWIEADASTTGSLLWLRDRIEEAREAGADRRAAVLEHRLARRERVLVKLRELESRLAEVAETCAAASGAE